MKKNNFFKILVTLTFFAILSCTSNTNDTAFLKKVEGRYLYTDDEIVTVHSKGNILLLEWRGAKAIQPSKINDDTFYVKEMNAKIQFLTNTKDNKEYLVFLPKNKKDSIEYTHVKMKASDKIPSQYVEEGNYEKALEGYLTIQAKDSLSPILNRRNFTRKGYNYLRNGAIDLAIKVFKINVALHPTKSNPYDSLGEAYLKSKDTANALTNYKKALKFDSGNRRIKRTIEKLQGKEANNTN